ncbi:MAG TPA: hypothetical protein VKZ53_18040 [Candidatus Angelobacter sp.]|nr:hypothetical protein [Candidatus Angelobacter sp.]
MEQPQRKTSPGFYRLIAILFFIISLILAGVAVRRHEWFFWVFAGITLMNACMATLRFFVARELGR